MTRSGQGRAIGRVAVIAAMLFVCLPGASASQRQASTSELKAAFVLNFVRFTEWPADIVPANAPIVVCLLDDTGVANALQQIARGRTAGSHSIAVRWLQKEDELRSCHVAYLSGLDAKRSEEILGQLHGAAVLTISDDEQFAQRGGVANFFVEHDNMGFAVNVTAVQRAKLQISAKLLSLAKIVRR